MRVLTFAVTIAKHDDTDRVPATELQHMIQSSLEHVLGGVSEDTSEHARSVHVELMSITERTPKQEARMRRRSN